MKVYKTKEIRNVALVGNSGSGKTILAESMAFAAGLINRRGEIDKKNTISDYKEVEQEQGNSVYSTVLYTEWKDKKINILDAPGGDDFVGGAVSSLNVADTAILVLNAKNGIEVGAETSWRMAKDLNKPVIIVANHLDHENVNFLKVIEDAREIMSSKVAIVQYPVNAGAEYDAVIDLVKMKMIKWNKDGGAGEILDIPADEVDRANELKNELVETAAESDEALMELFFENDGLTEDEMMKGLTNGLVDRELFPVFCTSAKQNFGVQRLLDFITNVAPSPDLMATAKTSNGTEIKCDESGPTALFMFKNATETHVGEVLFFKVMSGTIEEGQDLINQNKNSKERVSQISAALGKKKEKVSKMFAGDIGAAVKLKDTKGDHTLSEKGSDIVFDAIKYPEPKYRTAIKAVDETDEEKLGSILHKMHEEDPTIIAQHSKELKQLILSGQGEYHITTVRWHLDTLHKLATELFAPKIPYRETITKPAYASYRHKKQSGGAGQFGEVHMLISPYEEGEYKPATYKFKDKEITLSVRGEEEFKLDWGGTFMFYNCIVGGSIDKNYLPAIIKGIMEKLENSPLTGSYARDIRVAVYDGKMHAVDSNEISFKLAGRHAFDEAFRAASPKIMEPVYNIEVRIPTESMGDIMSDLQGRRAIIQGMDNDGRYEVLKAKVPLAELDKYSTSLSSMTRGRGSYTMEFNEYAQVSPDVQKELLKKSKKDEDED